MYHSSFHINQAKRSKFAYLTTVIVAFLMTACGNAETNKTTSVEKNSSVTNTQNDTKIQQSLAKNLAQSGIEAKVLSVTATSVPNIYWVKAEGLPAFFTDTTGQYIIQGDIVKVGDKQPEHVSANLMAADAKAILSSVDKKDMIIFPAKGQTKGVIYAFTDADCGYCRKLHQEIKETNNLGIEVRYLAWPRSPQQLPIMEKIWCSKDRNTAMTQAKLGQEIQAPNCNNPVAKLQSLGNSLNINGTPAIFTEDGHQIGGYLPPQALAQALNIK